MDTTQRQLQCVCSVLLGVLAVCLTLGFQGTLQEHWIMIENLSLIFANTYNIIPVSLQWVCSVFAVLPNYVN